MVKVNVAKNRVQEANSLEATAASLGKTTAEPCATGLDRSLTVAARKAL